MWPSTLHRTDGAEGKAKLGTGGIVSEDGCIYWQRGMGYGFGFLQFEFGLRNTWSFCFAVQGVVHGAKKNKLGVQETVIF